MFSVYQPTNHYVPTSTIGTGNFGNLVLDNSDCHRTKIDVLPEALADELTVEVIDTEAIAINNSAINEIEEIPKIAKTGTTVTYSVKANPVEVVIDRVTYRLVNQEPEAGEFYFNPDNKTIKIALFDGTSIASPVIVKENYPRLSNLNLKKNHLCSLNTASLSFLSSFNADGKITISRSFQSHASLIFTFTVCEDREAEKCDRVSLTVQNLAYLTSNG